MPPSAWYRLIGLRKAYDEWDEGDDGPGIYELGVGGARSEPEGEGAIAYVGAVANIRQALQQHADGTSWLRNEIRRLTRQGRVIWRRTQKTQAVSSARKRKKQLLENY